MADLRHSTALPALFALAVGATSLVGQPASIGYDDTPMQPNGKWRVHDSRRPRPPVVTAGLTPQVAPPSDAVVLLGPGSDASSWQATDGSAATWPMSNGILQSGKGLIQTKAEFADLQLHVEFATPSEVKGNSQERGNSGVFLAGVFEIQVLDSFENPTYADGQAAAMYGQHPPLVNASRKPGEWQSYDITFSAPRFNGDTLVAPAVVTVFHNGVGTRCGIEISGSGSCTIQSELRGAAAWRPAPEREPQANTTASATKRRRARMELGNFSVSLAVKDIEASKLFYEKLGFTVFGGNQSQNWLIMKNGDRVIGLFQGMFEKNILTFNPGWNSDAQPLAEFTDVRALQRQLKERGVTMITEADERSTGPASFMIADPDGNTILVDQHV